MHSIRTPFFFRFFSKSHLVCDMPADNKVIYLTFDDGPIPEITPHVLSMLKERNVKATFFCVGDNVRKFYDTFRLVQGDGHTIGNHTFNHLNGWKTPPGEYVENVMRCQEYFSAGLFRPPYGKFTPSQYMLLRKRFKFILWSVLSNDYYRKTSPRQCLDNVVRYSTSGSVVVFHDSLKAKENLFYTLPRYLDSMAEKGYRFEGL